MTARITINFAFKVPHSRDGGFYYKNFLQELPSEVSAGDVTGVTMTVKATDIVYANYLTSLCYYVNTAGNNSYFYLSWTQTSDADGYKTFNGTNNLAVNGLSAEYPFIWIMFGVSQYLVSRQR
jgi:hypothetical protein